jgi:hypothetical protein
MSDLSDLHGVFPTSLRWNAETGILAVSIYNSETGERELQEIELGSKTATFVMDMATRERGYGLIKAGVYDMKLTPVGSPPPDWPEDEEYKPALGCWLWNPILGELRLETNATIFRNAIVNIWDQARFDPQAAEGLQPVVRFVDRVPVPVKSVNKTFSGPLVRIINWVERDKVPGWRERAPTVAPPTAPPLLAASSAPAQPRLRRRLPRRRPRPGEAWQSRGPTIMTTLRGNDGERRRHRPSARRAASGQQLALRLSARLRLLLVLERRRRRQAVGLLFWRLRIQRNHTGARRIRAARRR